MNNDSVKHASVENIIAELSALLGAEHVITAAAVETVSYREKIARLQRAADVDANIAARNIIAIATPADINDLQNIIKLTENKPVSIWTMPNAGGLGSTPPPESGDIIMLDLKRMNGILEVNTSAAYALVEPGVTYQQMQDYLRDNNIPFWVDIDKNSQHSIADSIGAREFGYTPYGDHLLMQCGMEVVLANGNVVRTGMGAMPKSNTWQLFKYGYGPYVDGLFTQSNLGIVTKIGLWLMPAPPAYKPFAIQLNDAQTMAATVDALHTFKVNMLIPNTVVIGNAYHEAVKYSGESPDTEAGVTELATTHNIGTWNVYGALYGIPDNVDILWNALQGALSSVPGAMLKTSEELRDSPIWKNREQAMRGVAAQIPEESASDSGYVHFTLGAAIEGSDALALDNKIHSIADTHGSTVLTEFALTWRTMMARVSLPYRLDDADSLQKARTCAQTMLAELAEQGYGATHADSDILSGATETFNHAGINNLQRRVKAALDPEAIFG